MVERHPAVSGLAAFVLIAAAVRAGLYNAPLSADGPQFLYVGATVAHGGMPYVDAAYNKGPLTALLFAGFDSIVGTSPAAVRLTVVPFVAVAALALAAYVAHHAGRFAGALAGFTFAACSALIDFGGLGAQTEQYGVAPLFGALWLATRQTRAGAAGAGALTGCALLINPALVVGVPAIAVELWLGTRRRAPRFGAAAAGAALPITAACVWLAAGGALDDMLVQIGGHVSVAFGGHGGHVAPANVPSHPLRLPVPGLWIVAAIAAVPALRDPRMRRPAIAMVLVIGAVIVRVKTQTHEFSSQYYAALPALCALIALAVVALAPPRTAGRTALAAVVLAFPLWSEAIQPQRELLRLPAHLRNLRGAAAYPVAAFVRAHTVKADRIMVAGYRDEVYWLARRRAPTRFFDVFGLSGDASYLAERRRDLERRPPAVIVVMDPATLAVDRDLRRLVGSGQYVSAYGAAGASVWLRRDHSSQ